MGANDELSADSVRIETEIKIRNAEFLAADIRQLIMKKELGIQTDGDRQILANNLTIAQAVLGMLGKYDDREVLDELEKYISNLQETKG